MFLTESTPKINRFLLSVMIILLAANFCLALTNYSTNSTDKKTVKEIVVKFPGEERWVDIYEGGSGGGCVNGELNINIVDYGKDTYPYVVVKDEKRTIKNFSMVEGEVAKIILKNEQGGRTIRTINIRDPQDSFFASVQDSINSMIDSVVSFLCAINLYPSC